MTHRVLFVSHGGGPRPLLGDPGHQAMVDCLHTIVNKIEKPSAIIMVSAHWESPVATITSGAKPPLIYDYYNFPEESYHIQYPCPGEPELAAQVQAVLKQSGIATELDGERGFDHGFFVPLKVMYPDADIPCIQLSLLESLDPLQHINLGRALQNLDYDNVLVIGSGFTFHNLKAFYADKSPELTELNATFEEWLLETFNDKSISEAERTQRLVEWEHAPAARFCHPREEHLLPLHVCYGVTEKPCTESFEVDIFNKKSSMYLW